jgi:hypothetical protein
LKDRRRSSYPDGMNLEKRRIGCKSSTTWTWSFRWNFVSTSSARTRVWCRSQASIDERSGWAENWPKTAMGELCDER